VLEPELEQAIITNLQNSPNITKIIKSATKIAPDKYRAVFNDIEYILEIKDEEIKSINYKDSLENRIKITLSNTAKNIVLDDGGLF